MSGVKHTPGPWRTNGCYISSNYGEVGHAYFVSSMPEDVSEANARLIAAAPDHHAVALELDRLMLVIESAVRFADPVFKDEVQALLKANKAAIARARGEQDGGGE